MLELIDRLPRDTYYWQVITQDPEHAAMLVEAQERAEKEGRDVGPPAPPMSTWSPEVEAITKLTDRVNALIYVTRAANGAKGEKPPKPEVRPATALPSIKAKRRQEQHEKLAARLLRR
jgi:hypothetical protein